MLSLIYLVSSVFQFHCLKSCMIPPQSLHFPFEPQYVIYTTVTDVQSEQINLQASGYMFATLFANLTLTCTVHISDGDCDQVLIV